MNEAEAPVLAHPRAPKTQTAQLPPCPSERTDTHRSSTPCAALQVESFFDPATFSYSYVAWDADSRQAAIVDALLDFDPVAGRLGAGSAERVLAYLEQEQLEARWILDTHIHADHLTAAHWLRERTGAQTAIGAEVTTVQRTFAEVFHPEASFSCEGRQFDRLLADDDVLPLGTTELRALATPGHTAACMTYLIKDAAFVGDTLFMPDYGTARTDFPGGDARTLYQSIQRILALAPETRLFLCHDYGTDQRSTYCHETTVAAQRATNKHIHAGVTEDAFVRLRTERDQTLAAPRLLYPAVQFNMRGGQLPPADEQGAHFFKLPLRVMD